MTLNRHLLHLYQIGAVLNRNPILLPFDYDSASVKQKKREMPQGFLTRRGQGEMVARKVRWFDPTTRVRSVL